MLSGATTARNLGNRPANHATPTTLLIVTAMKEIGGFVEILEEKDMEKLGMGSLLSVSRGSVELQSLSRCNITAARREINQLCLLERENFDTGGISLKLPKDG